MSATDAPRATEMLYGAPRPARDFPLHADIGQCVRVDPQNVLGLVGEEVAGTLVALTPTGHSTSRPVGDAAPVRMHQPGNELLPGVRIDRALLRIAAREIPVCLLTELRLRP